MTDELVSIWKRDFEKALEAGRMSERAKIVAWYRARVAEMTHSYWGAVGLGILRDMANDIEAGVHHE